MITNKLICQLPKEFDKLIESHVPYEEMIVLPTMRGNSLASILPILFVGGIYFLCSKKELVYIGVSCNIGSRLMSHFWSSKRKEDVVRVGFIRYKSEVSIEAIEAELIRFFRPKYNKANGHYGYCDLPKDFNIKEMGEKIEKEMGIN